jgi:DNA-binding transcriptional regulator YiaG
MTGQDCKRWREKLGVRQIKLAWDLGLDATQLCRWESGVYKLKPEAAQAIEAYLQARLAEVKELEFPAKSMVLQ